MTVLTSIDARHFIASFVKTNPELNKPKNMHFVLHILLLFAVLAGLIYLTYHVSAFFSVPLFLYAGIIQYHFIVMIHEASHAGLLGNKKLNNVIGDCAGALITFSVNEYKVPHLVHHRNLGLENEPDYPFYKMRQEYKSFPAFLYVLMCEGTAFASLQRRFSTLLKKEQPVEAKSDTPLEFEPDPMKLFRVAFAQLCMFGFYWALGNFFAYFLFWLLPMFLIPGILNRLRIFGEHGGLASSRTAENEKDVLARTTVAPLWEKLILSPFNFNYHHEHHLVPSVPYTSLPLVHEKLKETGYYDRNPAYHSTSYASTYASIFGRRPESKPA